MMCSINILVFFFKQKTAYEMRISDWSSDVCSSDLRLEEQGYKREKDVLAYLYDTEQDMPVAVRRLIDRPLPANVTLRHVDLKRLRAEVDAITNIFNDAWSGNWGFEIGRATCRDRVC